MPKKSVAKKVVRKKATKAPLAKAKMLAKKKGASASKAKAAAKPPERNFMWRLLERKEAERKANQEKADSSASHMDRVRGHANHGFGRFAGPRRRAA